MAEQVSVEFAEAKIAARNLDDAGEKVGEVRSDVADTREDFESSPVWGTGDIGQGFEENYKPLADNLTTLLDSYHKTLTGENGLAGALANSIDRFNRVDQASAEGFGGAGTLEV
ncbi:uncharacterized protein YukE [Nocardia sp. GAS34]|uniref:hypothetical protein n=1 Tax=unclassified Nocardia TaxID=2637762 RepID=UPI003D1FA231